jgi:hypothetical protein
MLCVVEKLLDKLINRQLKALYKVAVKVREAVQDFMS